MNTPGTDASSAFTTTSNTATASNCLVEGTQVLSLLATGRGEITAGNDAEIITGDTCSV